MRGREGKKRGGRGKGKEGRRAAGEEEERVTSC